MTQKKSVDLIGLSWVIFRRRAKMNSACFGMIDLFIYIYIKRKTGFLLVKNLQSKIFGAAFFGIVILLIFFYYCTEQGFISLIITSTH